MPAPMFHAFADRFRQKFGRSISRLMAKPEYPVNDFADDPTMHLQQAFLAVSAAADESVRMGSGFVGGLRVPLSRVLPLIPRKDMDMVLDALNLYHPSAEVKTMDNMPGGAVFGSEALNICVPSYEACAAALREVAICYRSEIVHACAEAVLLLRREKVRERRTGLSAGDKNLGDLYLAAKNLRVASDPVRGFVSAYESAQGMLHVHCYLAARKAGNQTEMDALRENEAVSLFLRGGDLDE